MKELISIDQVSKAFGLPKGWIYTRTRRNEIPFVKLGKYVRFDPEEVARWLQTMRRGPEVDQ